MLFTEKTVTLKDGTQALLRSPRPEDAQALLDYLVKTSVKLSLSCGIRRNVR